MSRNGDATHQLPVASAVASAVVPAVAPTDPRDREGIELSSELAGLNPFGEPLKSRRSMSAGIQSSKLGAGMKYLASSFAILTLSSPLWLFAHVVDDLLVLLSLGFEQTVRVCPIELEGLRPSEGDDRREVQPSALGPTWSSSRLVWGRRPLPQMLR